MNTKDRLLGLKWIFLIILTSNNIKYNLFVLSTYLAFTILFAHYDQKNPFIFVSFINILNELENLSLCQLYTFRFKVQKLLEAVIE